jgi:hypothetical protein
VWLIAAIPSDGPEQTAAQHVTAAGGIAFLKESWSDAGAGNVYHVTGYSTLKSATCVSITFILHSSNPQMYDTPPPDYDAVAESAVFGEMLDTLVRSVGPAARCGGRPGQEIVRGLQLGGAINATVQVQMCVAVLVMMLACVRGSKTSRAINPGTRSGIF